MPFIFKAAGGYADNPADPGGPTNYGITLATLRAYEGDPNLTAEDVKKLTPAVARGDLSDRVLEQDAVRRAAGWP